MTDSQQRAVYAWEAQWHGWVNKSASQRAVRRAIRNAERLYRIPASPISFYTKAKNKEGTLLPSKFDYGHPRGGVRLRPQHCNIAIGLHEAAHAVMVALMGWTPKGIEDHGPQWLGVYLCLLADAGLAPRVALEASARDAGLRWTSPAKVGPKKIRKHYRGLIRKAREEALFYQLI